MVLVQILIVLDVFHVLVLIFATFYHFLFKFDTAKHADINVQFLSIHYGELAAVIDLSANFCNHPLCNFTGNMLLFNILLPILFCMR